ncbi:alpha/beta hydrolase [Ottowia sp.]|uniref:alpha/beta hydrolase n=1 Tax=Ottowia sp. TaxID=1898956 RepID=UPI0039E32568
MPVDPPIAQVLEAPEAVSSMEAMSLRELRNVYPPPATREPVGQEQDLRIPCAEGGVPARLYRPPSPLCAGLTVLFRGGGFLIGGIGSNDAACKRLCNLSGAAVLSIDYRLAPEHKFPAAPNDGLQAAQQAPAWELDRERLVPADDSAGGTLAEVTALRLRDEGERSAHRLLDAGLPVTLRRENGLIHGFFRMFTQSNKANRAVEDTARWIRRAMA